MALGDILEELRKEHKLTQKQLGDILNISYGTVHGYEKEKNRPSPEMLIKLADYFDVSVDYLLERTREQLSWDKLTSAIKTDNGDMNVLELYSMLRKMTPKDQAVAIEVLKALYNNSVGSPQKDDNT